MFKWLGFGTSHALADPRKARARLAALSGNNPLETIEEMSDLIESISSLKLEARADICRLIDEHSQPYRRKLGNAYFSADGAQRKRISFAFHRFATLLGQAYLSCIKSYRSGEKGAEDVRKALPLLICRAINAIKSQYKWAHLHSGLIDPSIWKNLFWLFAFAEKIGLTRVETALYPAQEHKTSILREFLKALMIASSAPDALSPWEFEIANHIVSLVSGYFVLESDSTLPDLTHAVDLSSSNPPGRLKTPCPDEPSWRFFGPGKAYALVEQFVEKGLPMEITRGGAYSDEATSKVLGHLLTQWSSRPLSRKSERRRVSLTFTITHRLDFAETESWTSENVSDGGYDAVIQENHLEWEKIGQLFFSAHGNSRDLCIIRRLNRDDHKRWHAGVEILSRNMLPVELRREDSAVRAGLVRLDETAMEANIVAEDKNFLPNSRYEIEFGGKKFALIPLELLEKGFDFRLWRCRLMARSDNG